MNENPLQAEHRKNSGALVEWLGSEVPVDFGDPGVEYDRATGSVAVVDRSYRVPVDVMGDDITKFLSGIISSETEKLAIDDGQPSNFLSAKGKLLAAFQTYRTGEDRCRLRFLEPTRDDVIRQLSKYAFLSDVAVQRTEEVTLSLYGPRAADVLREAFGIAELPTPWKRGVHVHDSTQINVYHAGDVAAPGYDLELPVAALASVWETLAGAAQASGGGFAGHGVGEVLRVEAGQPIFGLDYDDNNFPAEAGLESALSYAKCYVGQEIVARMRTYGHANRKLFGLRFRSEAPPAGTLLRSDGRDVARVTSPVRSPRYGAVALGMVGRRFWDVEGPLRVESEAGIMDIDFLALPFSEPGGKESRP